MIQLQLEVAPLSTWNLPKYDGTIPIVIAGPCSVETEEQVRTIAEDFKKIGTVHLMRGGVWKPRTRPNSFEGNGEIALQWLAQMKSDFQIPFSVEVATAEHVELALKYGADVLWIGARTTVNPFSVQEIADALHGVNIPVMVKNPVNPDLQLWIGALERVNKAGITKLAAIHRGFSNYETVQYRNSPRWEIPMQLMAAAPNLPVICDPSHISGKRAYIHEVSQQAMNYGMDGLMIETHPEPLKAWSDAAQQITPEELGELVASLNLPERTISEIAIQGNELTHLRRIVDSIDEELLQILAKRENIIRQIGDYKNANNVTIFQPERWAEILDTRIDLAKKLEMNEEYIRRVLIEIHNEAIRVQTDMLNNQ